MVYSKQEEAYPACPRYIATSFHATPRPESRPKDSELTVHWSRTYGASRVGEEMFHSFAA
jgi:hypothetical protein